jgi:hypothetical protein
MRKLNPRTGQIGASLAAVAPEEEWRETLDVSWSLGCRSQSRKSRGYVQTGHRSIARPTDPDPRGKAGPERMRGPAPSHTDSISPLTNQALAAAADWARICVMNCRMAAT